MNDVVVIVTGIERMQVAFLVKDADLTEHSQISCSYVAFCTVAPRVNKIIIGRNLIELHHNVIIHNRLADAVPLAHGHVNMKIEANLVGLQDDKEKGCFLVILTHILIIIPK